MLLKAETPIDPVETCGELTARLSEIGAKLLIETLKALENGTLERIPQDESQMTYDPKLEKDMGVIDWTQDAADIVHRIHGLNPWPGCTSAAPGGTWKLLRAEVADMSGQPGEVLAADGKEGLIVAAGKNAVRVRQLQVPGGKPMDARDYLRGHAMAAGTMLKEDTEMSDENRQGSGNFRANNGGQKRPAGGNRMSGNRTGGKNFGGKKPFSGEKRSFGGSKPAFGGEKRSFGGDKPAYNGEKRAFRGDKPNDGDKRPAKSGFGGEKRPYGDKKPPFGGKTGFRSGEKRPYGGGNGERRSYPAKPAAPKVEGSDGLPARRLALEVIRAVTENDAYASLVLDEKLNKCTLPLVDRRLAARLVYDTLEHLLTLDYALNSLMAKPDTDIKLRNVLRLGACQILLEDRIPESAACNTSVALCKELGMEGLAGVCNGILRNLVRQKNEIKYPDMETEPVKALSIRYSVPEWLVERLLADWGEDAEKLMGFHQPNAAITIRPNLMKMDEAAFEQFLGSKVWEKEKGMLPFSWRIRNMAEIAHDAGFVGGKFSIQSESSMMVCLAAAPKNGMQILDACAAPGGKSCLMAEMMQGTGRVQAWELHPHRADLIAAQVQRLGLENVRPMTRDALKHREELDGTMDIVLLDAPCSGLGVMSEKPDVKYRVTAQSVDELVQLQSNLLDAVCPYVKKGGTLVYSTCSVLKDENVRQAEKFLARHPEFELLPLPETIPASVRQYETTGLQLLPQRDGIEGFYMCRMRRKKA